MSSVFEEGPSILLDNRSVNEAGLKASSWLVGTCPVGDVALGIVDLISTLL